MAHRPPVVIQHENLHSRIEKDVARPKPTKAGQQARKALGDLSNTGKPPVSGPWKASSLKDKSASSLKDKSSVLGRQPIKYAAKSSFLTNEEMRKCHQWAKEGIEQMHFSGNNMQKLQKDTEEERVKKKVHKVMATLHEWLNDSYDLGLRVKEVPLDNDAGKMELEPEVLPSTIKSGPSVNSKDCEEIDGLFGSDSGNHQLPFFGNSSVLELELELSED
ncbi:uncharacterized protein LOC122049158 [Zingiber officinale]|uniref:uncharacterized protein LOC122049158 n=1 Tax=Zingiber officinale TaxID=94328 RepID=UPI001C4D4635|nr:uncharacterized protein LOC122049158 [Zingiber officinale]